MGILEVTFGLLNIKMYQLFTNYQFLACSRMARKNSSDVTDDQKSSSLIGALSKVTKNLHHSLPLVLIHPCLYHLILHLNMVSNGMVFLGPSLASLVLISLAYTNTESTLEARYTKRWQLFHQNELKKFSRGSSTPEQSIIFQSKDEAHWMSIAFVNSLFLFLAIFLTHFVLTPLALSGRFAVSSLLSSGAVYYLSLK